MSPPVRYTVIGEVSTPEIRDALVGWLTGGHIEDVCDAGALSGEMVLHDDGVTIEVRYAFASREAFETYEREHAPRLRAEGQAKFPEGVRFTRTLGRFALLVRGTGPSIGAVPLLRDNYAYLLRFAPREEVVIVDPSEGAPVLRELEQMGLKPTAIWCTHHHPDHVAGVPEILAAFPGLPVIGSAYDLEHERIPGQTRGLADGEEVLTAGRKFRAIAVPGHTLGAIAFVGEGIAFTGDTLFLGGCGRVFEGTMPMMHASLRRLSALDPETQLFVGHEYTESNLRFAATVEPASENVTTRLERVRATRARGEPTVPATLRAELETNPFLRTGVESVRAFAATRGDASTQDEIFARVREAKDAF